MEIDLEKLPFDLDFHPSSPLVTAGLITGDLHLYAAIGTQPEKVFEIHAHEESCRAVRFINGGTAILTASPDFSILATDVQTGATIARLDNAHEAVVNRLVNLTEITIASGDDNCCIKVWDTRQRTCCNSFDAHEEYISDMTYAADSLKLLGTSGDGTLSICNLRKNKVLRQSEFSEDGPLSIVLMKGLPTPNPYLKPGVSFNHGVNFAVAGSTALNTSVLLQNGILSPVTNSSLLVQLDWFLAHYQNLCEIDKNCDVYDILKRSLFMVGETGGNDYNYAFLQGQSIEDATALVPLVVNNIRDVAKKLIDLGATRLVVPGNFPIGCSPMYLTLFKNNDSTSYDDKGCLKGLNTFAMYHNQYLQNALQQLRLEYPNVAILYADYYQASEWVLTNAPQLGFETKSILKVCCGTGGDYNFSLMSMYGMEGVFACSNPDQYINWDGVHLTEKAYQSMADWLIKSQVFECIV